MHTLLSRDTAIGYGILLLLLVALRIPVIIDPVHYTLADRPELYTPLWSYVFGWAGVGTWASVLVAIIATAICCLIVNNMENVYSLVREPGCLTGFAFVVLSGGFRMSMGLHPVMIYAICLSLSIDRMYSAMKKERPSRSIFWSAAWATLGALFWAKGVWFLPFLLVMLFVLRVGNGRTLMAGMLGMLSIGVNMLTCMMLTSPAPLETLEAYWHAMFATVPFWSLGLRSGAYLTVMGIIIVASVLAMRSRQTQQGVVESRRLQMVEWYIMFVTGLVLLPGFSYEMQILMALGVSMSFPHLMSGIRSEGMRNVTMLMMIAVTAWYEWTTQLQIVAK